MNDAKIEDKINWTKLREDFFKECTTETPRKNELKKINLTPHNLFEWFKGEIKEYFKE